MHTKDARAIGETEQRIYALPAWRETPYFTARERAALAFTESVTLLADTHVPTADVRRGRRRVQRRRGRRAGRPDRDRQRLERHRRSHPGLAARLVPAVKANEDAPGRPHEDIAAAFLALHRPGQPLLLPNPWDVGSARVLASLGFRALASTSSGFAATLGRADGSSAGTRRSATRMQSCTPPRCR